MIETKEQYEKLRHDLEWLADAGLPDRRDLVETFEALRKAARAAKSAQRMWQEEYGAVNVVLQRALNAIPDWIKE